MIHKYKYFHNQAVQPSAYAGGDSLRIELGTGVHSMFCEASISSTSKSRSSRPAVPFLIRAAAFFAPRSPSPSLCHTSQTRAHVRSMARACRSMWRAMKPASNRRRKIYAAMSATNRYTTVTAAVRPAWSISSEIVRDMLRVRQSTTTEVSSNNDKTVSTASMKGCARMCARMEKR